MNPEQPELDLGIDRGWFHIMRPRLMARLISEIGETAWAVYTIIKAHADHFTGESWPGQARIGELIGKSTDTVARATKVLAEHGLIHEGKRGRDKFYLLLESSPAFDRLDRSPRGSADFQYVPAKFGAQLEALKLFLKEGITPGHGITLNLTVNMINQGAHSTVNLQNVSLAGVDNRSDMQELSKKLKGLLN